MIELTIGGWQKEARFLYKHLKELYEQSAEVVIAMQSSTPVDDRTKTELIDASWKVYCIEKNIKPEDYGL